MTESAADDRADELVERAAGILTRRGWTAATAESLTGGQLAGALSAGPDSGGWFRGGVVAYHEDVKHELLGVPEGPVVSAPSAEAMAEGTRRLLGSDWAVAATGVGGPDRQEGQPPGTVFIGVAGPSGAEVRRFAFDGEPVEILRQTVVHALLRLLESVTGAPGSAGDSSGEDPRE